MWVTIGFTVRMMLAVNGYPLAGDHAGRKPAPEPEKMRNKRMQVSRPVRHHAMQVNGHTHDGYLEADQKPNQHRTQGPLCQSMTKHHKYGFRHSGFLSIQIDTPSIVAGADEYKAYRNLNCEIDRGFECFISFCSGFTRT